MHPSPPSRRRAAGPQRAASGQQPAASVQRTWPGRLKRSGGEGGRRARAQVKWRLVHPSRPSQSFHCHRPVSCALPDQLPSAIGLALYGCGAQRIVTPTNTLSWQLPLSRSPPHLRSASLPLCLSSLRPPFFTLHHLYLRRPPPIHCCYCCCCCCRPCPTHPLFGLHPSPPP